MAVANVSAHDAASTHDDHDHEHHDNFITKYIFSTDHKMIAKQYTFKFSFCIISIAVGFS